MDDTAAAADAMDATAATANTDVPDDTDASDAPVGPDAPGDSDSDADSDSGSGSAVGAGAGAGVLVGIGVFARRVGVAPSALRFYDDVAVLRPAFVDVTTGYRYYAPDQEPRATLIRRLREAGVPLTDVSVVLDGPRERARAVLEEHARKIRATAASAQAALAEILRDLSGARPTVVRLGGAELAGAVRQVSPAVASGPARGGFPVLGCVLVELDRHEVRLVATNRYRLAVRALCPVDFEGDPCRFLVDVADLVSAASWAVRLPEVTITVDGSTVRLHGDGIGRVLSATDGSTVLLYGDGVDHVLPATGGPTPRLQGGGISCVLPDAGGDTTHPHAAIADADGDLSAVARVLPTVEGAFPDYRLMLEGLSAARYRVITDRSALGTAVTDRAAPSAAVVDGSVLHGAVADLNGPLVLCTDEHGLTLDSCGTTITLAAICVGGPVRIAFDPVVLLAALDASVGPDVLLEISSPFESVVVRSADQGGFTTLVMPVRDPLDPP
ncbi:MerR family transcriptional regulator [Umezawaea sp. Da 62-37]|uniref:MerR family transcriptional regulator n=1 Tax=Umezawaea sp. Da 62-37 TaxID=3075927 RepID=UPI0028F6EAC9|nr:MerR family transcriptional regulator [Umezawaea sp. Da 62-37]WNV86633.1 MerR family transcriptional regulator [Umezawaea sp. Da 62-37]